MRLADSVHFSLHAVVSHRLRSMLTALGITIGIAAVMLLTSIGAGVEHYVLGEFTQFGTNLMGIAPGKTTTFGMSGAVLGTVRPLSLDDSLALNQLGQVLATTPVIQGNALLKAGDRQRRVTVLGVGPRVPEIWRFQVGAGSFLADDDPRAARAQLVLGSTARRELFGSANPLGTMVRLGNMRFRVVGVMAAKGQILGFDLDDAVYVPVVKTQEMFNREGLMEIDVLYEPGADAQTVKKRVHDLLVLRHGQEDFTITTQEQMLDVLGDVLGKITLAVGALGAISLAVGGVGIFTIMTIAVNDRISEVGLLRALGATRAEILRLFLGEAIMLSTAGGIAGLLLGRGAVLALQVFLPALPVAPNLTYALAALALAAGIGLAAGVAPARRAAGLDPVTALRSE